MRKTLAAVLLGTTLLASGCSNKSADMRASRDVSGTAQTEEQVRAEPDRAGMPRPVSAPSPTTTPAEAKAAEKIAANTAMQRTDDGTGGEGYHDWGKNPWIDATKDRLSTFAADVDTASYTIARRKLEEGTLPPAASVRVEEFVNYFKYALRRSRRRTRRSRS